MTEQEEVRESTEQALQPADEAKQAMYEAVVQEVAEAQPGPTTRPEGLLAEFQARVEAELPLVNLNTATAEELQTLPGIGPALAARIVNHRQEHPFREPAELTAVGGISQATYQSIADRLVVGEFETEELLPEPEMWEELPVEPEGPEEPAGWQKMEIPWSEPEEPEAEAVAPPPPPPPPPPTRVVVREEGGWGRLLFVGLLSALAGAALALLALFLINNGTLDYRTAAIREAKRETYGLGVQIGDLGSQLNELQGRWGALQDLSARLDGTENNVEQLGTRLATAQGELDTLVETLGHVQQEYTNLREDVDGLAETVSGQGNRLDKVAAQLANLDEQLQTLQEATVRFGAFLDGLRALLNESMGPPTPWLTPTPTPTPMLSPQRATSTPVSKMTVIPATTPTPTPTP